MPRRSSSPSSSSSSSTASLPPPTTPAPPKKTKKQSPQDSIDEFWAKFNSKTPGKVSTILPQNGYAQRAGEQAPKGVVKGENAIASYDEAVNICKAKVSKIAQECRRVNQKYRDPHFDIEFDLKWGRRDCLEPLSNTSRKANKKKTGFAPNSVKRVADIFDNPQFYIDDPTANDVRQGRDGDCWFMAALCTLANKKGLIERVCVARDEVVGVYGFVFHRDGEWRSEVIDDKLYLTKPDYDESYIERVVFEDRQRINSEEDYRKIYQSNSGALYFAQCEDPNETWLPLMEKAYAKAHGDYAAIEGGFTGEGLEDLTGGVTTEILTTDILDKDKFWKEELLKVNDEFLFGCATGIFRNWGSWGLRKGIYEGHAYSVMKAVEMDGQRLLLLKNPWGQGEWNGPWSDGSREWTPEWMEKLSHRFGDDGAFWISFDDLLRKYQSFDRTRLFSPDWKVTQQWTSLTVPWTVDYHDTKFSFTLEKAAPVVIVLSQLDDRYFKGLKGQYWFELSFRVHKAGEEDYIVRSHGNYCMRRSVSAELDLDAGEYHVLMKIQAERDTSAATVEQVIRHNCKNRRDKLLRIGLAYDLAHSKGKIVETEEEKIGREKAEKKEKEKERKEVKERLLKEKKKRKHVANKEKKKIKAAKAKRKAKAEKKSKNAKVEAEKVEKDAKPEENEKIETTNSLANNVVDDSKLEEKKVEAKSLEEPASVKDGDKVPAAAESTNPAIFGTNAAPPPVLESKAPPSVSHNIGHSECEDEDEDDDDLSDIDSNVSTISSGTIDDELASSNSSSDSNNAQPPVPAPGAEEDEDEFERDPWNAVCVVGLRVYSKDAGVTIKIVRPKSWEDGDGDQGLDVDDSAKDAKDAKDAVKVLDLDDSAADATKRLGEGAVTPATTTCGSGGTEGD